MHAIMLAGLLDLLVGVFIISYHVHQQHLGPAWHQWRRVENTIFVSWGGFARLPQTPLQVGLEASEIYGYTPADTKQAY